MEEQKEMEDLTKLESQLDEQRRELAERRRILASRQREKDARQTQQLLEQQHNLDLQIERDRAERLKIRDMLIEKRQGEKSHTKESMVAQDELWDLKRSHALDHIAMKRIELEDVQKRKRALENALSVRVTTLDEIDAEKKRRGVSKVEQLQSLLERADHIQEALEHETFDTKLQLAEQLTDTDHSEVFRLADELAAARHTRFENDTQKRLNLQRDMNRERMLLHQKQQEITRRKKEHSLLQQKGVDFLAALELGDGPPKEYILRNLLVADDAGSGDEQNSDSESEQDINTMLAEIETAIPRQQKKLNIMRVRMERNTAYEKEFSHRPNDDMESYDGSLGPSSYSQRQQTAYKICSQIMQDVVNLAFDKIFGGRTKKDLIDEAHQLLLVKQTLHQRIDDRRFQDMIRDVSQQIQLEIVQEEVQTIHDELVRVDDFVSTLVKDVLFGATLSTSDLLKEASSKINYQHTLSNVFTEMQKIRAHRDESGYEEDESGGIRLPCVHSFSMGLSRVANESTGSDVQNQSGDDDDEDDDVSVLHVKYLPSVQTCQSTTSQPQARTDELRYWERMHLHWASMQLGSSSTSTKPVADCASLAMSPDGRFAAVGSSKGTIAVMDLGLLTNGRPAVVRVQQSDNLPGHLKTLRNEKKGTKAEVSMLCWSMDSTQLLGVYGDGTVWVWNMLDTDVGDRIRNRKRAAKQSTSAFVEHMSKVSPAELDLALVVGPTNFCRAALGDEAHVSSAQPPAKKKKQKHIQERAAASQAALAGLACRTAAFHPALTVLGRQPCIMLGTDDGSILKWNPRHSSTKGSGIVYGHTVANSEPGDPHPLHTYDSKINNAPQTLEPDEDSGSGPDGIRREFFVGHHARLLHIGFIHSQQTSITVVSVDETGHLKTWPYTRDAFSGFGWYVPKLSYKIDFTIEEEDKSVSDGQLVQVEPTRVANELVLLVRYPQGWIRLFVVRLSDSEIAFSPSRIELQHTSESVQMAVSSVQDSLGSDYVYLLLVEEVQIFSVATMQRVASIPLPSAGLSQVGALGPDHLIVGAPGSAQLQILSVEDRNSPEQRRKQKSLWRRPTAPIELRVRHSNVRWTTFGEHPEDYSTFVIWQCVENAMNGEI